MILAHVQQNARKSFYFVCDQVDSMAAASFLWELLSLSSWPRRLTKRHLRATSAEIEEQIVLPWICLSVMSQLFNFLSLR